MSRRQMVGAWGMGLLCIVGHGVVVAAQAPLPAADSSARRATRTIRFETTQGTAMNVDVSPDGKTVVFDLLGDLYTVPITGGTATRLTSGPAFDAQPVYSPDGQRIAFVSDRSGSDNIWLMDADGRNARAFTTEAAEAVMGPEWVPAGEFLLSARKADGHWLYRADGNATALRPLFRDGTSFGMRRDVAWSPDARFLYWAPSGSPLCCELLWRLDVARGTSEAVSQTRLRGVFRPVVSPDGRWVAFGAQHDNQTGLRLLNLASGEERWLVYPLPDRDQSASPDAIQSALPRFAFTPDGQAIVLATGGTLQRIDVRTGARRPIPFRATVEHEVAARPAPPPTSGYESHWVRGIRGVQRDRAGKRMIFAALGKIWVREGPGPARLLAEQPLLQREPALSPDGQSVAYVTWHEAKGGHLWRAPVSGDGPPQQLTTRRGVYRHPVWSPDGAQLAVVREEEVPDRRRATRLAAEVYVLPARGGPPRRIAVTEADDVPAFSADGTQVLVVARPAEQGDGVAVPTLLAVPLGTGAVDTIATLPAGVEQVAVAPDGQTVAYTQGQTIYTAGIQPVAGLPPGPVTVTETGGLWPATSVSAEGGRDLRWAADGRTLTWVRHDTLVRVHIAAAGGAAPELLSLAFRWPRPDSTRSVALEGATVITMRGDEVLRDATVLVTGSRIAAVGARDAVALPAGVRRIDVAGTTIIPGLIDLHGAVPLARDLLENTNIPLAANLAFGVTTVRAWPAGDDGAADASAAALRDATRYDGRLETGTMVGARFLTAGAVTATEAAGLTSLDAARALVRRQQESGATVLMQVAPLVRRQQQWLAAAASEVGLPLVGESGTLRHALTLVLDGYHALQGTIPDAELYDDVRQFLAAAQTVYVPTLLAATGGPRSLTTGEGGTAEAYFLERIDLRRDAKLQYFGLNRGWPIEWRLPEDYHFLRIARQAARLAALNVPVAVGTAGKRPGLGVHWEIWALELGGFSPHAALRAATTTAAAALGLERELGTIETGKIADLVVLDGDPLADLRHSLATRYVMKRGRLFDAATLAMLWPEEAPPPPLRDTRYDPPLAAGDHVARRSASRGDRRSATRHAVDADTIPQSQGRGGK